jgi:threonine dehydrogenase-like Zn-dependent dehydrogenase
LVREVELPPPAEPDLVETEASALSAGTELAVYTGTHQWLKDPNLPDWKFPFRSGYSAAGRVMAVGSDVKGWQPGDRVSYPGNHASAELLTLGHERGRLWRMPDKLDAEKAAWACIARYGLQRRCGRASRWALRRGAGPRGHRAVSLRCLIAAGANPVVGIDAVKMRATPPCRRRDASSTRPAAMPASNWRSTSTPGERRSWQTRRVCRMRCRRRYAGVRRRAGGGRRQPARPGQKSTYDDLHRRYLR